MAAILRPLIGVLVYLVSRGFLGGRFGRGGRGLRIGGFTSSLVLVSDAGFSWGAGGGVGVGSGSLSGVGFGSGLGAGGGGGGESGVLSVDGTLLCLLVGLSSVVGLDCDSDSLVSLMGGRSSAGSSGVDALGGVAGDGDDGLLLLSARRLRERFGGAMAVPSASYFAPLPSKSVSWSP